MSPIRIILEVSSPEEEALVRQHHAFLQEMSELALKAPSGHIFDVCEEAVLEKGKEHNRRILEQAVQKRIKSLEKKTPLRTCECGRKRENRGLSTRSVMSCLGLVQMSRRWWGSRCACVSLGYGVDAELGLNGHHTRVLQRHIIRLGADVAFSKVQEHLAALLRVKVSKESLRQECHRHGKQMAKWQPKDTLTPKEFFRAPGAVEFTTDAGKVNTLEEGWKDLKIGVFQKRPCADPATPEEWDSREIPAPTAQVAWAAIAPIKKFSKTWRGWGRRLGVKQTRDLHVLGDGASWIWQSVEQVFTGCVQTLDVYHGCQHLAQAGDRLYGECTKESAAFLDRGRKLLLKSGWLGNLPPRGCGI